jgi:hypothetical protein
MNSIIKTGLSRVKFILAMVAVASFLSLNVYAQGAIDAGTDPDFPDVPLDGGMSLLIGAGALYVGKRLRESKKANGKNGGNID